MCINTPWLILTSIPFHHHGVRKRRLVHVSTSCLSPLSLIFHIKLLCSDSSYAQLSLKLSVQFSSVAQSCPTLCDSMNCSTPGLLVHHQLLEFTQTHIHRVSDAIQPSHPLSSPSPPAPNHSEHQSLFQ